MLKLLIHERAVGQSGGALARILELPLHSVLQLWCASFLLSASMLHKSKKIRGLLHPHALHLNETAEVLDPVEERTKPRARERL